MSMLPVAQDYTARGLRVVPVPHGKKGPIIKGWQELLLSKADLPRYFNGKPQNIGILWGAPSGWTIEVDLDHPLAVELAAQFLPQTKCIFGREQKAKSHYVYRVTAPINTKQFDLPKHALAPGEKASVVEIRSTGTQTLAPGSTHPDGYAYSWDSDGEPAEVTPEQLIAAVEALYAEVLRRLCVAPKPAEPKREQRATRAKRRDDYQGPSPIERAEKWLAKVEPAVDGQRGHDTTFRAACGLLNGFELSEDETYKLLAEWNLGCKPPWSEHELWHKIADAASQGGERGWLLNAERVSPEHDAHVKKTPARKGKLRIAVPSDDEAPPITDVAGRTERANAQRLHKLANGRIVWVEQWAKFLIHSGKRWEMDHGCRVDAAAKKVATRLWREVARAAELLDAREEKPLASFAATSNSARSIKATKELFKSEPGVARLPEAFDSDPWALNVQNGTLDLRTLELRPHRREDFLTKLCPVEFDIDADCPTWLSVLNRIMDGRQDLVRFLQRAGGMSLTGKVREHVLLFLHGAGANGKSLFINTLLGVLGDYGMQAPLDLLMAKPTGGNHPTELADLSGRRLVACVEVDEGRRMAEALVKQATGGDKIRARRMREDHWEFSPSHHLWLLSNHKPIVRGSDNGIWRRIKLIPFSVTIPPAEQDHELPEKLKAEHPGILNWMLTGCRAWQIDGLQPPAAVDAATDAYRAEMNTIGRYIDERCVVVANARVRAADIYANYRKFVEAAGERALNQTRFGMELGSRGFEKQTSNGVWYLGIGLVDE